MTFMLVWNGQYCVFDMFGDAWEFAKEFNENGKIRFDLCENSAMFKARC